MLVFPRMPALVIIQNPVKVGGVNSLLARVRFQLILLALAHRFGYALDLCWVSVRGCDLRNLSSAAPINGRSDSTSR